MACCSLATCILNLVAGWFSLPIPVDRSPCSLIECPKKAQKCKMVRIMSPSLFFFHGLVGNLEIQNDFVFMKLRIIL